MLGIRVPSTLHPRPGLGIWTVLFVCLLLLATGPASAQTTFASITGTVTDSSGAVVPGAKIEAIQVESNYRYTAVSNDVGNYTIAQLREGTYMVRTAVGGFQPFEAKDIQLVARDLRRLDIKLTVNAVTNSVEVTAGATVIETETARVSDTRTALDIKALPITRAGFALWGYLAVSPGITPSTEGSWRRFSGSGLAQSSASIDGITTDDLQGGNQISPLTGYVDSFQEVRIDSANNSAEFGTVGMVTVISKSGTNQPHGALFDYYSSPVFRARNPFAKTRTAGINHSPGGTIGGPVYLPKVYNGKDKTFFFFSFETVKGSSLTDNLTPTVPLEAWRTGDFSKLAPDVIIHDPLTGTPFPNNTIPASRINPVSAKIQERFYPLPNYGDTSVFDGSPNIRESVTRPFDPNTYWTTRIDHRLSDKSAFFARVTMQHQLQQNWDSDLPTIGPVHNERFTRALASSYTYSFRPDLLNEVRYGLNFNNQPIHGPLKAMPIINELGLKGLYDGIPDGYGVPNVNFSDLPISAITQSVSSPIGNEQTAHLFQENLSWFHHRHSIKAGFNYLWTEHPELDYGGSMYGNIGFSDRFTGFDYADFLLGIPTGGDRNGPPVASDPIRTAYDFFVTDEFRVNSRLTLSLGLRYEYHPYWHDTNGLLSTFDIKSGKIVVPNGALSKVNPLYPKDFAEVVEAKALGYPGQTLLASDKNNFAPRIGLAYRPWGNNTVFRAGWGIYYDSSAYTVSDAGSPFSVGEPGFTNPQTNPTVILPWVFPQGGVKDGAAAWLPTAFSPGLTIPYTLQQTFSIDHQQGSTGFRITYAGTGTRHGLYRYNINQPQPSTVPFVDKPRMFPNYAQVMYSLNGAGHQYNGLTTEIKRPMARGLMFQAAWVWARDIGDIQYTWNSPEDAYDLRRERAPWVDIPTHRITGSMIYDLPVGKGKQFLGHANRLANAFVGGWTLSLISQNQTGQFLTPMWSGPDPAGTTYSDNETPSYVTLRPNILHDPNLPADQRTLSRWFDPTAFGPPTPGSFGTSAKGVIVGPGSMVWHAGIAKVLQLGERAQLRAELIALNVLNHPNWGNPRLNITSAPGVITSLGGGPLDSAAQRTMRASMRLEF